MVDSETPHELQDHPATAYRIVVKGSLDESWGERLAGLTVAPDEEDGSGRAITVLTGPIRDRAELAGVLNTLYELRLELLSVNVLSETP